MAGKLKIKVCGMREAANIKSVADLAVDFMGFIFYKKSPRFVGNDFVMPVLPKHIQRVGVFVTEQPRVVLNMATKHKLDFVQLHGNETVEEVKLLKEQGLKIIKAIAVNNQTDFSLLSAFVPHVVYFLFDTKTEVYGGSGKVFDWSVLSKYNLPVPFLLSGGIGEEQLNSIQQFKHPRFEGIDLNSRVEISVGVKNSDAIRKIISTLKQK